MSRIGRSPIILDPNVFIKIKDNTIMVKGPKGEMQHSFPSEIRIETNDKEVKVERNDNNKKTRALHGLSRTIVNNMVIGVSKGFSKILEIQGVGYRAQVDNNNNLMLNLGYSHPIHIEPTNGIKITVENNNKITVTGINKAKVGQIAAQIREMRPPEPYKGKGIRYQNEVVRKKVGKAGK